MAITTTSVEYPTRARVVAPEVKKNSAFISACGRTDLLFGGVENFRYRPAALTSVGEGEAKPVGVGAVTSIPVHPHKLANIEVITEEAAKLDGALTARILEGSAPRAGHDVDLLIASGGNTVVDGFALSPTVAITSGKDVAKAYSKALESGQTPSAFVVSTAALANLYSLGLDGVRNPLSALNLNPENPGTIMGLPVYVFASADPTAAWLGDFKNAAFGNISVPEVRISREATLYDEVNEETYHLFQNNQIGILTEVFVGFKLADPEAFVTLDTTPVVEDDETPEEE